MPRPPRHTPFLTALLAIGLAISGCSDDPDTAENDDQQNAEEYDHPEERTADCDPLMPEYCSMPWPSNLYLEDDDQRATGYTLDFGESTLPRSLSDSEHIANDGYRRLDGYGLGTPITVLIPGVDTSGMPAEHSIEDSIEDDDRDALFYEVTDDGLEPVPFWAELDVQAESPDEQVLYLRPAVILEEDTRYVVGFRNLVDDDGDDIERSSAFQQYVDGEAAADEELAWRQDRFDDIFEMLDDEGIDRDELTLAWDFHTGSSDGLHGELLQMIDDGVAEADEQGIDIAISSVVAQDEDDDPNIAYEIQGTFEVPHFLEDSERAPSVPSAYLMHRDEDGDPAINDTREADFWLQIPHSAVDGTPHALVNYGHGMLGSGSQVLSESSNERISNENDLIYFGADFIGFSEDDVPLAIQALSQPTYFEELVDRMHQGVLEYVLLTQAMKEGLASLPEDEALEDHDVELSVDDDRIYYTGISQGGIYGVTVLAVDPTVERGHLGVPGHNYAMMMERSSNFYAEPLGYADMIENGFERRIDQSMVIPIIQLLWDKIDPISYLRRLEAEPFDDDMPKSGLFAAAKGDYQVAVVTKEITARSDMDIPVLENYDRERGQPWGVDTVDYPHDGSGLVLYDFGNPWPEPGNIPPDDDLGDPHGEPRSLPIHNDQLVHFLDEGEIIDVCDGEPCYFPAE